MFLDLDDDARIGLYKITPDIQHVKNFCRDKNFTCNDDCHIGGSVYKIKKEERKFALKIFHDPMIYSNEILGHSLLQEKFSNYTVNYHFSMYDHAMEVGFIVMDYIDVTLLDYIEDHEILVEYQKLFTDLLNNNLIHGNLKESHFRMKDNKLYILSYSSVKQIGLKPDILRKEYKKHKKMLELLQ